MLKVEDFVKSLNHELGVDSYFGVPDSVLRELCRYLTYGVDGVARHVVGVNEGNCVALAAGRYLATGMPSCVYMQNSGIGNCVNPILSLTSAEVYNIPIVYLIGWRGAPGEKDEPQHIAQGKRTTQLLELLDINYEVIDESISANELIDVMKKFNALIKSEASVAFLIKKGSFAPVEYKSPKNGFSLIREEVLEEVARRFAEDKFVCSTGMVSREMFEVRERLQMTHEHDFLMVGSMGHASAIALGAASALIGKKRLWCLDGDGSALMHMGSFATFGAFEANCAETLLVHLVFNNACHESVGKIPSVGADIDFCKIADACGYDEVFTAGTNEELSSVMDAVESAVKGKILIEARIAVASRADLGRPTQSPAECKEQFMRGF